MSASTERALITVLVLVLVLVLGGVGYLVFNKSGGQVNLGGIFGPNDVAVFGQDTFDLCHQGSDSTQGYLPANTKLLPIDEQANSRYADIYNRLPASRLATTKAELRAILCVRSRVENVESQTYYKRSDGQAVAGCILERYVADLFLIDVTTRQTVSYVKVMGPDPKVACEWVLKEQTVSRGDPVSIDAMMQQVNTFIAAFRDEESPVVAASPAVAATQAATVPATAQVVVAQAVAAATDAGTQGGAGGIAQAAQPGKLVFTCSIGGIAQVFTMAAKGQNLKQLTRDRFQNYRPIWSPDGTQIAFHSNRAGNLEVYVMNADGSNLRRLTNHKSNDMSPTWSQDGKWIAFASNRGGSYDIYIVNAAGGTPKYITTWASNETAPSWSLDGSQITFLSDHDKYFNVYRVKTDGTGMKQITFVKKNLSGVTWSPDGTQIAYADSAGISIVNNDGTGAKRVADTVGDGTDPGWSPDGSAVVYASSIAGKRRIYTVEIGSRMPIQLTPSDMDCWQPNWSAQP